ncbi:MAG: fibronectin type III domain-containing protein, partial [Candidatus Thermoplasmatota archaeon]|nr:fibronectin type III domain-containing protein [Candidatus Thermoplasmatota archaeon]
SKEVTLSGITSFNPILETSATYLSTVKRNGSSYDLALFDIKELFYDDFSPRNLSTNSSYFKVSLEWEPPHDSIFEKYEIIGYKLYRGRFEGYMPLIATLGNVTSYRDVIPSYENLTYYYQVSATFSTLGESVPSNTVSDSPLIPEPPTILTSDPGDLTIDISWSALDQEVFDAFLLEHYTVYRGIYPDALRKIAEVAGFSYHDTDIDIYPATYYYMVTYTLDTVGMGEPSNMISEKPNTYPGMPSAVDFGEITNGVKIKWKAPLDNGCCPIISYNIFKGNHTLEMDLIVSNPAGTMNIDQTDLTPGQNYYYSITAVNRLGESIRTQPLLVNYLGVSSRPRDLIAAGGEGQIELKWIEPKVTWGLPIDSYYIYKGSGSGDTSLYKTVDGDVTSYTDIVMNGIDHTYEVSAVNSFGESQKAG